MKPRRIIVPSAPKKATIGRRPKDEVKLSDSACTPLALCELLPWVDFDPCSNDRSQVKARWAWSLEKGVDGLKMRWLGSGYMNFPYSNPMPFCVKALTEMQIGNCTELITLCKLDPSTEWWKVLTKYDPHSIIRNEGRIDFVEALNDEVEIHPLAQLPEIWMIDDRLQFDEHPDLIEQRRLDRIAKRRENRIAKGKDPDEGIEKVNGESSNNFCSVIIHHRPSDRPSLDLRSIATRWVRA